MVTGHGADEVEQAMRAALPTTPLDFVRQHPQRGTGHAVQQAVPLLGEADEGITLVLNGDVPLITADTARAMVAACGGSRLALLTVVLDDPAGYGRIVRAGGGALGDGDAPVHAIVEHKDANDAQRAVRETYTGVMAAPTRHLRRWLAALRDDNAQGEYYLTDVVAMAVADGVPVRAVVAASALEVAGVNSPQQLAALERGVQRAEAERLMEAGVRLADPARIEVRGRLVCGADVEIDVGCVFEGEVALGDGVRIGPYCVVRDARLAAGVQLQPFSHVDGAEVGAGAQVGPFARLRPGAVLGADVHVGNFVEIKNSTLGDGAKANHLAYLGDATVGARVNFGAGSITANYDGAHKHRTSIGADAHVGSNCVLIAPVAIGEGATIGGGSTISKNAPAGALTVARARQATIPGWTRPRKKG